MTLSLTVAPKWWLDTKRGVGVAMVGIGTFLPLVAGYFGITVDAASYGEFVAAAGKWFDATWMVVGYALWLYGTFRPTAPITLKKPV